MFDFTNYTYSGLLTIVAAVFGIAYPQINSSIERIDDKYGSSLLAKRLQNEKVFAVFKILLAINLFVAVINPFLLHQSSYCYVYICVQTVASVCLIGCFFHLYWVIQGYSDAQKLQSNIWKDFEAARGSQSENPAKFFREWTDLACYILCTNNKENVRSIHDNWLMYVRDYNQNHTDVDITYDKYAYDGITQINRNLCKINYDPLSNNNGNEFLTLFLNPKGHISDDTYTVLWKNLKLQIYYGKDEWVVDYWKRASDMYDKDIHEVYEFEVNEQTGTNYTAEQVDLRKKERTRFLEFNIMLCVIILQQRKYSLLRRLLECSCNEPPIYPLVPSTLADCLKIFSELNEIRFYDPFLLERRYPMPQIDGLAAGRIIGAANMYIALLMYRLYTLPIYPFGVEYVFSLPSVPKNTSEIKRKQDDINVMEFCIEKLECHNKYITNILHIEDISKEIERINRGYNSHVKSLSSYLEEYKNTLDEKEQDLKENQPYDKSIVDTLNENIHTEISKYLDKYKLFIHKKRPEKAKQNTINATECHLFPNQAFVNDSAISYVDIDDSMSSCVKQKFSYFFASTFFNQIRVRLNISNSDIFSSFDRLEIENGDYVIITFGVYWDYYIGKIKEFERIQDTEYKYKNIPIYNYDSGSRYLSNFIYVLKKVHLPILEFVSPSNELVNKYRLDNNKDSKREIWIGLNKIKDLSLSEEEIKSIDGNPNELSLYACFLFANILWKSSTEMICIKNMYIGIDNGNCDNVENVKSFHSYFSKQ